ncbi:AzlC family ABC transporter permease [Streptomyces albogriseolus]|uniref:AzlC family ABC transporter permease n=1 Tax=Streptomyces albogriseolus TaxID=1887 RepID=UPI003D712113
MISTIFVPGSSASYRCGTSPLSVGRRCRPAEGRLPGLSRRRHRRHVAAATGLLLNTRTAAFSLAVAEHIGRTRLARLAGARLVTDGTVAFTLAQRGPARRRAAFWVSGIGLFTVWNAAVPAGVPVPAAPAGLALHGRASARWKEPRS